MSIKKIREDIRGLRGAEVSIFGQPTKLDEQPEEQYIDILEVLDVLEPYEVKNMTYDKYNEEADEFEEVEFDDVEQYLDYLDEVGDIEEKGSDNSYNWSGRVSNDFVFHTYENMGGEYLVEFAVHRFGDVRVNYTVSALLKFNSFEEFYEVLGETTCHIELGDGFLGRIDLFESGIEVMDSDYNDLDTIYDIEDFDPSKYQTEEV